MDFKAIGLGVAFALMWSSAFTAAHIVVNAAPPLYALAFRFLFGGIIAVILAAATGQSARLTRAQWRAVLVFGICQNVLYLGLNFVAMQRVEASVATVIASSMPLLVGLAGWIFLGDRLRPLGIAGLVAGFAGVGVIMSARLSGGLEAGGLTLCVLSVFALTFATLMVRGATSGGNLLMVVGLQMLVGSAVLFVVALPTETFVVAWSLRLAVAFVYTVLISGLLATWVWFKLVARIGAVPAATFHFLNPFLGVLIAAAVLGEKLEPADLLGVVIIAAGIFAVQISKQRPTPAAPTA